MLTMTRLECSTCNQEAVFKYKDSLFCEDCAQKTLEKVMALGLEFIQDEEEIRTILLNTMEKV